MRLHFTLFWVNKPGLEQARCVSDLTLTNTKLLVKLLSPETANIKNLFYKRTHFLSSKYPLLDSLSNSNIPNTIMHNMASDAEDILEEVDSIMGEMITYPVGDTVEKFLDDNLMRLETLMNDVRACLKQYISWNRRYKDEKDATLKLQVDEEVSKIEADFKIYKLEMAEKGAFQSTPPSPLSPAPDHASPAPSPPCPEPGSARLCAQQNQTLQPLVGDRVPDDV